MATGSHASCRGKPESHHQVEPPSVTDAPWHSAYISMQATHIAAKGSVRESEEGHVQLFGGRPSVLLKHMYPHRLVLEVDTHDVSIEDDAREAAKLIMSAYGKQKTSGQGKGVLPKQILPAFQRIESGTADCCALGAADQDCSFWDIPEDFFSAFEKDSTAQARLKFINGLRLVRDSDDLPLFSTDAAKWHYDRLKYQACGGAVKGQEGSMTIQLGDVVAVQLDSCCVYSFSGHQHDLWVVKEIFVDRNDQLRLDCQLLVHPGDEDGHLKGQGQSSFDGKPHGPWELKQFRERCVDVAKEMASEHARAFAVQNSRLVKEHRSISEGLRTDVTAPPENVHTPDLIHPANLALARHGRLNSSREFFLRSDSAQGSERSLLGLQHIRSVARDFVFLEPDQAPPADGPYCRFMQHTEDRRYTDLMPGKEHAGVNPGQRPLKLFAGAGGLDHAAPESGWTVDSCASSCLTNKGNKPTENVFHMGVEEFTLMCHLIEELLDGLEHVTMYQEFSKRDGAEAAAREFTNERMRLAAFVRDACLKASIEPQTLFALNNETAVKTVLQEARQMGSFDLRHGDRIKVKAQFDGPDQPKVMQAICSIATAMHSQHAAANKAEIEALHLDDLFVDVYLPHFMTVYALEFAEAFVSGMDKNKVTDVVVEAQSWELTLSSLVYLHAKHIPLLHNDVLQAVARAGRPCPGITCSDRHSRILHIIDFRLADDAKRFPSTSKLKGFLKHKLMRVDAMLFFCCKTEHCPLWLPPEDIVARGGRQKLTTFIKSLIKNKTLPQPGAVSTMLAGPPCQDISAANPHSSKVNVMETDQVRNNMVFPLLQAVEYFRPRYVVVEQVPAAVSTDRGSYATTVQAHLLSLGYQTHLRVINSEEFGAPQSRRRMFLLAASRGQHLPELPQPFQPMQSMSSLFETETQVQQVGRSGIKQPMQIDAVVSGGSSSGSQPPHRIADQGGRVEGHKACLWDAVSDLPHVPNGAYLGMIRADAIAAPRSVFQHYCALKRKHRGCLPERLCMVLGAAPYIAMAAEHLIGMELNDAEAAAASRLLQALRDQGRAPDRFAAVLGQGISSPGLASLQKKVHAQIGHVGDMSNLKLQAEMQDNTCSQISSAQAEVCKEAMNSMVRLVHKAVEERKFCSLLLSISTSCPPATAAGSSSAPCIMRTLQQQLCDVKQVAEEVLEEVQALGCEDMAMERPGWRDHNRKGTDGIERRWSCANRLQRITLTPAIVEIKAALGFQLEQVNAVVGENSKSSDFSEHAWIFNHLPVELTVNEEALVASLMPATDGCYTTLQSLAMSQQVAEAACAQAASEQGVGRQLLVSGRHARTHAFLNQASSYRRPPLHAVPATVTGQPRVQAHSTDNHPVLDRTLTLLELKRCQGFPDNYTLLALPDAVEDRYSGALKLSPMSRGTCIHGPPGSNACNLGPFVSLDRAYSMLFSLSQSIWSLQKSTARNMWRLVGNAVCVLVAKQLHVGLQAAMQAPSMSQGGRHAAHDCLDKEKRNGPWFLHGASAVADLARSHARSMVIHPEWQQAMDLHRADRNSSAMHAGCVPATQDPPASLLGNAYSTQLPGFLKAALHGSTSAAAAEPVSRSRVASGAEADIRLPYALAWDGPEVRRLAQLWRSQNVQIATKNNGRAARPAVKLRQQRRQPPAGRRAGTSAKRRRNAFSSETEAPSHSSSSSDESGHWQSASSAGATDEVGSELFASGEESEPTEGAPGAVAHLPSAAAMRVLAVRPARPVKKRIQARMCSNPAGCSRTQVPQRAPGGRQPARAAWGGSQGDFVDLTAAFSSDEGAAEAAAETPVIPVVHGPAADAGCARSGGAHANATPFRRVRFKKVSKLRKGSCARVDAAQLPTPVPQGLVGCSKQAPAVVRGPRAAPVLVAPRAGGCPIDVQPVEFKRLRLRCVHAVRLTELVAEGAGFNVGVRLSPAHARCQLEQDGDFLGRGGGEHGPRGRADRTAPVQLTPDGEVLGQRAWDGPSHSSSNGQLDCADAEVDEAVSGEKQCSRQTEDVSLGAADPSDRGDNVGKGNEYHGAYALDSE